MSDPGRDTRAPGASPKIDSETLALRARPQRVARFNRRVVIGVAAGACILVFAATMVALYPPSVNRSRSDTELLNTDRKQVADGLAALPRGYGDLAPKPPKLGPPLPGDLGPPVTHVEQNLGIPPQPPQNFGLRPNPEEDANRAERMRLARQAQEALESKVFFAVSLRQGQAGGASVDSGGGAPGTIAAPASDLAAGATPAQVALAWLLRRPDVIAIPKASNSLHVHENRKAADITLPPQVLAELDAAFPPPHRAAPLAVI